jgi:hypothetical protein
MAMQVPKRGRGGMMEMTCRYRIVWICFCRGVTIFVARVSNMMAREDVGRRNV